MYVFLGGTCNDSDWRERLIPLLEKEGIEYFNPVVADWTAEAQEEEKRRKRECDVHLYVVTKEMTGVFSIAEAVDSAWTPGKMCFFQVISEGFTESQLKSFRAVISLIEERGGFGCITDDLFSEKWLVDEIIDFNENNHS